MPVATRSRPRFHLHRAATVGLDRQQLEDRVRHRPFLPFLLHELLAPSSHAKRRGRQVQVQRKCKGALPSPSLIPCTALTPDSTWHPVPPLDAAPPLGQHGRILHPLGPRFRRQKPPRTGRRLGRVQNHRLPPLPTRSVSLSCFPFLLFANGSDPRRLTLAPLDLAGW